MQAIAAWLVARPLNGVIGLALTIWLQSLSFISAIVLVVLILSKGLQRAMLDVAMAIGIVIIVGALAKVPLPAAVAGAVMVWLPATLFSVLLQRTRSLTLVLQISVLLAVAVLTGIFVVAGDLVEYWLRYFDQIVDELRRSNQYALAQWVETQKQYADQMTMVAVFANWLVHSVALVLGYKMYRSLPGTGHEFGRFRDLNLGKVIASVTAIMSILGMLTEMMWFQHVAFITFGAFWLQGFGIVHWLYGQQMMPRLGLVLVYTMLLSVILSAITVIGLAIFGYMDAWFRLRRVKTA
ncbi:MAG: hypothetical protein QNJ07_11230 [Woeseiaceae bacterium]|nr:hypothetical protein [Woeseiaceae bacterium]